jgi:hypothetical protein
VDGGMALGLDKGIKTLTQRCCHGVSGLIMALEGNKLRK